MTNKIYYSLILITCINIIGGAYFLGDAITKMLHWEDLKRKMDLIPLDISVKTIDTITNETEKKILLDRYGYPAQWERNYQNCLDFENYPDCPEELLELKNKIYPTHSYKTEKEILREKILEMQILLDDLKNYIPIQDSLNNTIINQDPGTCIYEKTENNTWQFKNCFNTNEKLNGDKNNLSIEKILNMKPSDSAYHPTSEKDYINTREKFWKQCIELDGQWLQLIYFQYCDLGEKEILELEIWYDKIHGEK